MKVVSQDLFYVDDSVKAEIDKYITKEFMEKMISISVKKGTPVKWVDEVDSFVTDNKLEQMVPDEFVEEIETKEEKYRAEAIDKSMAALRVIFTGSCHLDDLMDAFYDLATDDAANAAETFQIIADKLLK